MEDTKNIIESLLALFPRNGLNQALPVNPESVSANDVWAFTEGKPGEVLAKFFTYPHIHLVIHEPHGDLGYLGREFFNFNAVEPVDIKFQ